MPHSLAHRSGARRAVGCTLSLMLGLAAPVALLLLAGRPALAAPLASIITVNPGDSIQAAIDGANAGDTIVIQPGTYTQSLTLSSAVSLTGVSSATVILQALPSQRVLTATNGLVNNTVVISGLTFTGGDVTGASPYPANCGGGIYLAPVAEPQLINVIITGNVAASGGGLCALDFSPLHLKDSQVLSNTATSSEGGGARVIDAVDISGGRFQDNQCLGATCNGGGLMAFNTLVITGTQFFSNSAQAKGGAVDAGGALTLTGGLFQHNQCADTTGCDGGALYANSGLTLTGTQFISNVAHLRGGALYVGAASQLTNPVFQDNACTININGCVGGGLYAVFGITLTNASFLSNTALFRAGGAFANSAIVLKGGLFQNNTCTQVGCHGGAVVASGALALTNTQFLSNSATGSAGAMDVLGVATMTNGLFRGNSCSESDCDGGGLRASTLALNGTQFFSNTASNSGGAAVVLNSGALTSGLFQGNNCAIISCMGGAVVGAASLALTDTQFLSNTAALLGGAVFINNAASVSGGKFQNNQCTAVDCNGGGLYSSGTLALTGTQLISNTATGHGGGAYALGATSLSSGLFQRNQCTQGDCEGGGLIVFVGSPLTLTNMTFLSNTAQARGGGVDALGTAALSGGLFQGNSCTQISCTAGGLYVNGTLALSGTTVAGNLSRLDGAGVLAQGGGVVTNGLFQGNACSQDNCQGGGLNAEGTLTVTASQFLSNTSHSHGAGAYAGAVASVTVSGSRFQGNQCSQTNCTGGGLYEVGGLALSGVDFVDNSSHFHGGGLYAAGVAVITSGLFQDNHCTQDNCQGGGLHAENDVTLSGTQFISNSARFSAGGVYANTGAQTVLNGGLFQGNSCSQTGCRGGGINVNGSIAITGTQFIGNAAVFDGGGLRTAGPATVVRAVFKGNSAFEGGGFYHAGAAGSVVNTLFVSNLAAGGGEDVYVNGSGGAFNLVHDTIGVAIGLQITPAVQVAAGSVGITNTLFFYHDTAIARAGGTLYEDYNLFAQVGISVTGGAGGGTHSHLDPNVDLVNPTGGDFHLTAASKAIDAGVNAGVFIDFEGQPRPLGNGFDIGYDEALLNRVFLPVVRRP